jgi:hypothetical protein
MASTLCSTDIDLRLRVDLFVDLLKKIDFILKIIKMKSREKDGNSIKRRRRADNTMAKRYQRVNQNPCSEEEQATQWPKDTKGVIRIRVTKKSRQHNGQKIPKG